MILAFLYDIFSMVKFLFGLGALFGLLAIGFLIAWYVLRAVTVFLLRGQPASRFTPLRRLFLDL